MTLLFMAGCSSVREEYTTRYGLSNTTNPATSQTAADESYPVGVVGQQYIEEYDKKYHEKHVLRESPPVSSEEEAEQQEAQQP
jgi:hypothetical protein